MWKPATVRTTACVLVGGLIVGAGVTNPATAHIVGVVGPLSSLDAPPAIIPAPSNVLDQCVTSGGQWDSTRRKV
jgi:hypothetical protein